MTDNSAKGIGEFSFISYLARIINEQSSDIIFGIGDDTAVIDVGLEEYLLFTCDCQIGNVHYLPDKIPPDYIGRRLAAVNVSDICAMGGIPRWALIGLNVPKNTDFDFLKEFYDGLLGELKNFGVALVGGNCSGTLEDTVLDMFLVGSVPKDQLTLRKGSRPGDFLVVTGHLGLAKAGLELLLGTGDCAGKVAEKSIKEAIERFSVPRVRVEIGRMIAENKIANAMIDVSDGLLQDALHLCEKNSVDVEIWAEEIPVHPICREVADFTGNDPLQWALTGGEDYELLFSVSPDKMALLEEKAQKVPTSFSVIGRFDEGKGRVFLKRGNTRKMITEREKIGWTHF